MVVPKMKRINTIGIRFTKGEKTEDSLVKILDKIGIPLHEVGGMVNYGIKRHMIKLKTEQMYQHLIARYIGYPIKVDNTLEVEIDDLSSYKDRVKVTRVPFEMTSDMLKEFMGRFGEVDRDVMCTQREGKFKNIPMDEAIV